MYRRKIENAIATVIEVLQSACITHRPYTSLISLKTFVLTIKFPIKDRFLPDELGALEAVVQILKARGIDSRITKAQSYSSDYNVLVYIDMSEGTCQTCSYWDDSAECLCSDAAHPALITHFKTHADFGCVNYKAKK